MMNFVFTLGKGAWKFYAFVRTAEALEAQLTRLKNDNIKYIVVPTVTDDFNQIHSIEDSLNM